MEQMIQSNRIERIKKRYISEKNALYWLYFNTYVFPNKYKIKKNKI